MYSDDVHDRLAYDGDAEILSPGVQDFLSNRVLELDEEIKTESDSSQQELKKELLTKVKKIVRRDVESKLMIALLAGSRLQDAAKAAGISATTAWRIRKRDEFRAAFAERRQQLVSESMVRLQRFSGDAVDTLHKLMIDPKTPPAVRKDIACEILDRAKALQPDDLVLQRKELEEVLSGGDPLRAGLIGRTDKELISLIKENKKDIAA